MKMGPTPFRPTNKALRAGLGEVPPLGWVNTSRPRGQNPDRGFLGVVLLKTQCVFNDLAGSPSPCFG